MMSMVTMASAQMTDYHAHCIPASYRDLVAAHGALFDEGFPLPQWTAEAHLQLMDEAGIETAVLTLPAPHPWFGDSAETRREVRRLNEETAALCRQHPGKFRFCAILPLPDVEAAIAEARYALDTLGAAGVKLATNVSGQYLGHPDLDTLMQFLSNRHALVILHPHKPSPVNDEVMRQTPLAMQEYLSETTRAVCNMISRNVLAKYPNMRVVVPHAGAYLPIALSRMRSLLPVMQKNGLVGEIDFDKNISCLWFDLAGSPSEKTVKALLTITTRDRLLYGSDYPYVASPVIKNNIERMKGYMEDNESQGITKPQNADSLIVRIAEIEVYKKYLQEYLEAAKDVGAESVAKEPGVVCIFPMQVDGKPTTIRIVEIYRDAASYKSHLQTPHFLKYKQGTLHMVKKLKLTDTKPLAPEAMQQIFRKW